MRFIAYPALLAVGLLVAGPALAEDNPWAPKPKSEKAEEDKPKEEPKAGETAPLPDEEEWETEDSAPAGPKAAPGCPLALDIQTEGAFVILDGKIVGKSPLDEPPCPEAGEHTLVVQKDGHVSISRTFVMSEAQQVITVTLTDEEESGRLFVTSSYEGAKLYIDGQDAGLLPWKGSVAPGPHEIKIVDIKGKERKKTNVLILKGETKTLHAAPPKKKKLTAGKLHWGYITGAGGLAVAGGVMMLAGAIAGKKHHDEYMDFREEAKAGVYDGEPVAKDSEMKNKGKALNGVMISGMIALGLGLAATGALFPFTDFTAGRVEVQASPTGGSVTVSF
ncbi:MAG: PEGA domain-containing protein [Deltaproteobacteria bacterium]|nr:PEGA domain-containing protein [Deltaproteobacteria bacterium]